MVLNKKKPAAGRFFIFNQISMFK